MISEDGSGRRSHGRLLYVESRCQINGNDQLGEGLYVGSGATFVHQVSVGDWSVIGGGAVVVDDIPERVVAVGVPAKVVKLRR